MEFVPKDDIFEFKSDALEAVRKDINLEKPGKMRELLNLFDDWVKKQSHMTKRNFSEQYLENIIITSKGSLEKAKAQLDKLCTLKTLVPHYFSIHNVLDLPSLSHVAVHCHLPKTTKEGHRVYVVKMISTDIDSDILMSYCRFMFLKTEYVKLHDYNSGFQVIVDCRNVNVMNMATKLNPVELHKFITILLKGYGTRLIGIHIWTPSKLVDALVCLLKQMVSAKIGSRIQVHKTIGTIHEVIPKKILPVEYGGEEISLEELYDKWLSVLSMDKNVKDLKDLCLAHTNETNRQVEEINESYMGMPGTFRTLCVD